MAVTAAVTPIRIVCANTLGAALRQADHGVAAQRTFRFRHTGNLQAKFAEARQVLGMAVNYQKQLDEVARGLITQFAESDQFRGPACLHTLKQMPADALPRGGRYRVSACDVCRRYLKAYDARNATRPVMVAVDTIATLPLDAAAMQRGYVG